MVGQAHFGGEVSLTILIDNPDLLEGFRSGKREVLTRVYEHFFNQVSMVVCRGFAIALQGVFVPGVRQADEQSAVVQEVFLRAFEEKARNSYDGKRPYRPYLLRIAKNLMIDRARKGRAEITWSEMRKLGKEKRGVGEIDELISQNESFLLDDTVEENLDFKRLHVMTCNYLETLDEESRDFVTLRFVDGLSQSEVAAQMGVTRRRVRTLQANLVNGLRAFLKKQGIKIEEILASALLFSLVF